MCVCVCVVCVLLVSKAERARGDGLRKALVGGVRCCCACFAALSHAVMLRRLLLVALNRHRTLEEESLLAKAIAKFPGGAARQLCLRTWFLFVCLFVFSLSSVLFLNLYSSLVSFSLNCFGGFPIVRCPPQTVAEYHGDAEQSEQAIDEGGHCQSKGSWGEREEKGASERSSVRCVAALKLLLWAQEFDSQKSVKDGDAFDVYMKKMSKEKVAVCVPCLCSSL